MSHPLAYFCDTPQTRALTTQYGDHLHRLSRQCVCQIITILSIEVEGAIEQESDSDDEFVDLASGRNLNYRLEADAKFALESLEGLKVAHGESLLMGLATLLYVRET